MKRTLLLALVATIFATMSVAHAGDQSGPPCSDIYKGLFGYPIQPGIAPPAIGIGTVTGTMYTSEAACTDVSYVLHVVDASGKEVGVQTVQGDGVAHQGSGQLSFSILVPLIDAKTLPPYVNPEPTHVEIWGETILADGTHADRAPDAGTFPIALNESPSGQSFH